VRWIESHHAKALACSPLATLPSGIPIPDKRRLERLALSMLLKPIGEIEGIVHLISLKYIEAAVEQYLPAMIGDDMSSMDGATGVKFPSKPDADRSTSVGNSLEVVSLLVTLEVIFDRHEVDRHFILYRLQSCQRFHQFHEIASLVEKSDVGIGDRDLSCIF
jgi:hypothetical protein